MTGEHHGQGAGRATVLVRAVDEILGTHNRVETDHGRLKARLRPMRGLKRRRSARIISAGHAFVQNLRRGHYELATDVPDRHRIRTAFDRLALTI